MWLEFDEDGCGVVNGQLSGLESSFNNVRKSHAFTQEIIINNIRRTLSSVSINHSVILLKHERL